MAEIIGYALHQIDVCLFLEDITPVQMETLLGGCCHSQGYPSCIWGNNIAETINNAKQQTGGTDNKKYRNQKINTIDNSKKTYLNGVVQPNGKPIIIYD